MSANNVKFQEQGGKYNVRRKRWEWKREDGPGFFRKDGPAQIYDDGLEIWFDENGEIGRDDGPATMYPSGTYCYFKNGKPHKEDGPACYDAATCTVKWYIKGNCYDTVAAFEKARCEFIPSGRLTKRAISA